MLVTQVELQEITDYITRQEHCLTIPVRIRDVRRGRRGKTFLSIPTWACNHEIEYVYYYVIHETVHHIGYYGHGFLFRKKEQYWLKQFGLVPVYKKVYPKTLRSLNGQTLWSR